MDGATVDGLAVAATAQPGSSALDASSAGVQEAALNLLQALLQVSTNQACPVGEVPTLEGFIFLELLLGLVQCLLQFCSLCNLLRSLWCILVAKPCLQH